jgi:hypothetical protein
MVEVRLEGVRDMAYNEEIAVTVTGPAGLTTTIPAFWRSDREAAGWHARFTPPMAGAWELAAADGSAWSAPLRLTVTDEPARGFVRVDANGFRYENGEPFVPMGPELPRDGTLADYRAFFASLDGATATRLRLSPDWTVLVERARFIDKILELAAASGVAVMMTLGERLTDITAEDALRLRYIAARWAAYPSVWAWQWWDDTSGDDAGLHSWIAVMTPILRAADPYGHPITTGYDSRIKTAIWGVPALDFVSCRLASAGDPVVSLPALASKQRRTASGKPIVLSFDGKESDLVPAALFGGFAGVLGDSGFSSFAGLGRLSGLSPSVPLKGAALALVASERALVWLRTPVAVTVRGLDDGSYTATWVSVSGAVLLTERVVSLRGSLRLSAALPGIVHLTR